MGKKYIITLPDDAQWLHTVSEKGSHVYFECSPEDIVPYTEPDFGQIEAIEKIKQCGQGQEKIEHDYQWHADGTSEPTCHITACRPFSNYYHPGFGWSAERRDDHE